MEQIKKLAIVIPAYKGRFLKETLDSIAVQAHKDEFVLYIEVMMQVLKDWIRLWNLIRIR